MTTAEPKDDDLAAKARSEWTEDLVAEVVVELVDRFGDHPWDRMAVEHTVLAVVLRRVEEYYRPQDVAQGLRIPYSDFANPFVVDRVLRFSYAIAGMSGALEGVEIPKKYHFLGDALTAIELLSMLTADRILALHYPNT